MKRLAIITTHPIQYNAPWFKLLAQNGKVQPKVFYTWEQSIQGAKFDPGFGKKIEWDIPLLEGYQYTFVKNVSDDPGSHHFKGIINPSLTKEIKEWKPDAILVMGWSFQSNLKCIRYFHKKIPVLFRGDSTLLDEKIQFSCKKILRRIFLTWVYKHVDTALYVGTANKDYYLKHGLKESQLVFAPHAVDNKRFIQTTATNKILVQQKRSENGIADDLTVFLFAGKFEKKKNPALLIDAFIKLDNIKTYLLLVGNGIEEEQLKEKVAKQPADIRNRIQFMPFQNQSSMPDIYCLADVFCLPSQGPGETWGLAVNEAMACSKPVLVSNKCGCSPDLVKDEVNGFVVKSNDVDDLCNKMRILSINKDTLFTMGERSLQIIQQWSYEKICSAIEKVVA